MANYEIDIQTFWSSLKQFTDARIGLGHCGVSVPTHAQLAFQLAHAKAKDAVHLPLDRNAIKQQLNNIGISSIDLSSQVKDRVTYLQRPDKGRLLSFDSQLELKKLSESQMQCDATIVLVDGLSSSAVHKNGVKMSNLIFHALQDLGLHVSPVCVVTHGRVAIGDDIGQTLKSRLLILLVGERPGLSSPDSLGIYYTYQPKVGITDEKRNCISNIREGGLSPGEALKRLMWLIKASQEMQLSGIELKDKSDDDASKIARTANFLLS